ncbi:MAG TPA: response regulator transcription factor, partial [Nocardioides sp.]|nr:response regulator transcription factor [Nocardioides sp.]
MPEVVDFGVRELLKPYAARVALRDPDEPALATDLRLLDPYAAVPGFEPRHPVWVPEDTGWLVFYTWRPVADASELFGVEPSIAGRLRGWLTVGLSGAELVDALERIHGGEVVIAQERGIGRRAGVGEQDVSSVRGCGGLTAREREVLGLIASGLSNQQIVDQTLLSINSIKSYIRAAYRKIGATSRSEAVLWAVDHGLRSDPDRPTAWGQPAHHPRLGLGHECRSTA